MRASMRKMNHPQRCKLILAFRAWDTVMSCSKQTTLPFAIPSPFCACWDLKANTSASVQELSWGFNISVCFNRMNVNKTKNWKISRFDAVLLPPRC